MHPARMESKTVWFQDMQTKKDIHIRNEKAQTAEPCSQRSVQV